MADLGTRTGGATGPDLGPAPDGPAVILTPDQRVRVFVSSTLQELALERAAVREAITQLHFIPVMFELGARPHPPRTLYRAYLEQSHIFVGIYWERYGWTAPDMDVSGLEDEYNLSGRRPKLIYVKSPSPNREPKLADLLKRVQRDDDASYKYFSTPEELRDLVANDLALLLTESFEVAHLAALPGRGTAPQPAGEASEGSAGEAPQSAIRNPQSANPNNLPVQRGSLVGRSRELADVRELLLDEDVGVVTLTGPGGSGKTRLSLALAADFVEERTEQFCDGVFFVPLAAVRDPQLVVGTISQALGLRQNMGETPEQTLQQYLSNKRILLILDNFEQVTDAAPIVMGLLEQSPGLKVLVTSRSPLRLRGEKEYPVPPLELPEREKLRDVERLSHYAAVELFICRAQEVKPSFEVTKENAAAVAEICYRLDGLPLAIELAAARIKLLPPKAILSRLGSKLDLLTGGARDLPTRQQTLRNAIGWSYDLLNETARTLFRRLGVFVGGWTLDAAEAICNPGGEFGPDLLDELSTLIDNSLVRQTEGLDGEPRFAMLETIREYAQELLSLSPGDEAQATRRRHAEFYMAMAEEAAPYLRSGQRGPWLEKLEAELGNLRAVLAWADAAPDSEALDLGMRLLAASFWFYYMKGHVAEERDWCERLLAHPDNGPNTAARVTLMFASGSGSVVLADYPGALARLHGSISAARELGDKRLLGTTLTFTALLVIMMGDNVLGRKLCEEAITLCTEVDDRWTLAFVRRLLADAEMSAGRLDEARATNSETIALLRAVQDPWLELLQYQSMATLEYRQGNLGEARAHYVESSRLAQSVGDRWTFGLSVLGAANIAVAQGDCEGAVALLEQSFDVWSTSGNHIGMAMYLALHAMVAAADGKLERAATLLAAADTQFSSLGYMTYAMSPQEFAGYVESTRAKMEGPAWQVAWDAGKEMSVEQAVEMAHEES